ncbi:MAG: hypothetical protein HYT50_00550 [Candidatus Wildermuthbacteria bacterium]|nr:hypothetical protein [Candidatus Wildermuthbacteria bacterium]
MTKRQRTSLFLSVVVFFLLATPFIILYSQGYRFDWLTKHIIKTGGIHIEAIPSQVDVFLNDVFARRTGYIFDSTFLGDLRPDFYNIRIEKEGFTSWSKTLQVLPTQLTQIRNVILFPKNLQFQTVLQGVRQIWPAPSDQEMLVQKNTLDQDFWELVLWDPSRNSERRIMKGNLAEDIVSLEWNQDASRALVRIVSDTQDTRIVWNIKGNQRDACVLIGCSLDFLGKSVVKTSFIPESNNLILVTRQTEHFLEAGIANYITKAPFQPVETEVLAAYANEEYLFTFHAQGMLKRQDISLQSEPEDLLDIPYPIGQETQYELFTIGNDIFVQEGNTLFERAPDNTLVKFAQQAQEISPSKDKRSIAHSQGTGLFVSSVYASPDKLLQKRTTVLSTDHANVSNLIWLANSHVFFTSGNAIMVAETDVRDRANIALLGTFPNPSLFWHEKEKTLYVLSEGFLFASEKLMP